MFLPETPVPVSFNQMVEGSIPSPLTNEINEL